MKSMVPPVARGSWEELSSSVIAGHTVSADHLLSLTYSHACVCVCVCVHACLRACVVLMWYACCVQLVQVGAPSLHIPFVNPVNGQICLTWNKSPHALRGTDEPRLLADVLLEELSVSVSERQYHSFLMEAKDCCEGRVSVGVRGEGEVCGGAREGEL